MSNGYLTYVYILLSFTVYRCLPMSKKSARRIKLSKNLVPFVSRVVRDGERQRQFAKDAKAANDCVSSALKGQGKKNGQAALKSTYVHQVVIDCQRKHFPKKGAGPAE